MMACRARCAWCSLGGELAALPHEELAVRLAEAYRVIGELVARVELLERRAGQDPSTSSRPPSSDSPYKKQPRDRSLRERGKRRPGKQPGEPGTTMRLVDDPQRRFWYPPATCRECGTDLADAPVIAQRRHQVTGIRPAPPPGVTGYVAQAKQCPWCDAVSEGGLPAFVRARASSGPEACAQAANLTCANYVPVQRAADLMSQLAGVKVSTGWVAGVREKAAALVSGSGFMGRVRELLRDAPAVHADDGGPVQGQDRDTARAAHVLRGPGPPRRQEGPGSTVRRDTAPAQQERDDHRSRSGPGPRATQRAAPAAPHAPVRTVRARHHGGRPPGRQARPARHIRTGPAPVGSPHGQETAQDPRGLPTLPRDHPRNPVTHAA